MLIGMVTVASVFALGFVFGRIWEIRLKMRLEQAKPRGPELTEHAIGPRLRFSIEQTLISLGLVEHQSKKLKATRR
jgi:hypothetical protein